MKRYINKSHELVTIDFEDGTTQFLFRGQKIDTDKKVKEIRGDCTVMDSPQKPRYKRTKKTKASSDS